MTNKFLFSIWIDRKFTNKRKKIVTMRREWKYIAFRNRRFIRYGIGKSYNFPRPRRYLYSYGCCSFGATLLSIRFPEPLLYSALKKEKKKKKLLPARLPVFPSKNSLFLSIYFFYAEKIFYRFILFGEYVFSLEK